MSRQTRGVSEGSPHEAHQAAVKDRHTQREGLAIKSVHHPRPPSPVPSGISMQTDQSIAKSPHKSSRHGRSPSPVSSEVSMLSYQSAGKPIDFAGGFPQSPSAYTDTPRGVLCAVCPKKACKSCLTCMASFCELHVRHHYTVPALQQHRLVEATGDLEQRMCPQHHRELEFYCRTDQTPVCALCVAKQHGGHDIAEQGHQVKDSGEVHENLLSPKSIQFISVKTNSLGLTWGAPEGLTGPLEFRVTWRSEADRGDITVFGQKVDIENLTPGEKYMFTVATLYDGCQSPPVSATVCTDTPGLEYLSLEPDGKKVSVSWSKPAGVNDVSYLLTLNSGGECLNNISTKSRHYTFSDLEMGREYSISVTVKTDRGQSKPISKTITIGKGQLTQTSCDRFPFEIKPFPKEKLIKERKLIKKGSPSCYLLSTDRSNITEDSEVRRWTFEKKHNSETVKNILVVGETGTGKTTLINTMVNYMLGVQWTDKVWFQITEEETTKSQAQSQTTAITVYEVFVKTSRLSLRIIDTPGYGSTQGFKDDKKMAENLHTLFRCEDGINEISAVCLVVKAGCNRLTHFQQYIFDAILSLFGDNVKENIVVMITHSDGMSHDVFTALNEAKVPCAKDVDGKPLNFIFNNRQTKGYEKKDENMWLKAWDLSYDSMTKFLTFLCNIEVKELEMTKTVMQQRKQLEACVSNLQDAIKMEELKQSELQQIQRALMESKIKCVNTKDLTYEIDEPYKDLVPIKLPWWKFTTKATCCTICEENCHYPGCWWASDPSECSAIIGGKCTVCTKKCPVSAHVKHDRIYVSKTRKVKKVAYDLKQKYKEDGDLRKALEKSKVKNVKLLEEAYECIVKLEEIALKKNSRVVGLHLDFLIEKMKETKDHEKVQKLEQIKELFQPAQGADEYEATEV